MNILSLFKRNKKEKSKIYFIPKDEKELIKISKEILLNKTISVNNGGGGFDDVKILKFDSIENRKTGYKKLTFIADDDGIVKISYEDNQIIKMYNEYLDNGKIAGVW